MLVFKDNYVNCCTLHSSTKIIIIIIIIAVCEKYTGKKGAQDPISSRMSLTMISVCAHKPNDCIYT